MDRERSTLTSAAARYSWLRGLFLIPLGIVFVLSALANWGVGPLRHVWAFPIAALLVGAVCLPIQRFYVEHYGRLSPSSAQQVRISIATAVGVVAMLGGSALLRSEASWSLDLPVNAIAVCFAAMMLVSYAIGVGLVTHHVVIWGALLVVGAMPVWTGADPSNIGLVLCGVAVAVCGVLDHRLFVQTFGTPTLPGHADGDAGA
jgi:hypothetical protein